MRFMKQGTDAGPGKNRKGHDAEKERLRLLVMPSLHCSMATPWAAQPGNNARTTERTSLSNASPLWPHTVISTWVRGWPLRVMSEEEKERIEVTPQNRGSNTLNL